MTGARLGAALARDGHFLLVAISRHVFLNTAVWTRNFTISIAEFSLKSSSMLLFLSFLSGIVHMFKFKVRKQYFCYAEKLPCYDCQHTQTYLSCDYLLVNVVSTKWYEFSSFAPLETVHLLKINISLVVAKIDSSPETLVVRIHRPLGVHDKVNTDMESQHLEILRQCDMAT